ncbi:MAG: DUF2779 domain-containing protein [bacterium]|nr:DUF2779 domain-containing protein [bacterium]
MASREPTVVTASQWRAALQCARRVWLHVHAPETAEQPDAEAARGGAIRGAIARRARERFPGAVAVGDAEPEARTRALLVAAAVPAIVDGVVSAGGARVRVDVLSRRSDGRVDLWAVRAAPAVRAEHLDDLALQHHVLDAAGVDVAAAWVLHLDREQIRDADEVPVGRLLRAVDVGEDVRARAAAVPARLATIRATRQGVQPDVVPSPHCQRPHRCPFWAHCTAAMPDDWIMRLPRLAANQHAALHAAGVTRIGAIPGDWWLTGPQARARLALRTGRVVTSPGLAAALAAAAPPAGYLDFETISPAVPLFPGTRPYDVVPFQWSLHREDAAGALAHAAFLADGAGDPRPAFVASLLAATAGNEPILVYSGYEARVLDGLGAAFPADAAALAALRARLVDLLEIVLAHVYHPAFAGSFSLKRTGPVLAPDVAWGDAGDVQGGLAASEAFLALRAGAGDAARLRRDLLAYCAADTRALVGLHRALRALAGAPPSGG